jgi:hypothetical protein
MGNIMSIILQGSTSGSVTLQEPAVAGTTVLTLPAVSGTVLTTTSPKAGNVIQVVSVANKTGTSTTGNTYIASTLAASITPTSSSSKILVFGHFYVRTSAGAVSATATLYRNSTDLTSGSLGLTYAYAASSNLEITAPFSYLDSPSTTSSTTYTIYFKRSDAAGTAAIGNSNMDSVITLMEIAA